MTNRAIPVSGLVYVTLFAVMGCADSADATADAWTVTDSAGIRIVQNHTPEWTSETAWSVSALPTFSVNDALDDPNPLVVPADAIRLNDGRIAFADGGAGVIALYEPNGQRLANIGRKGGGPGEFQTVWFLDRWRGDSIITYDNGQRRYSVFDAKGEFGRSYGIKTSSELPFATPIDLFADGGSLMMGSFFSANGREPGLNTQEVPLYRSEPEATDPRRLPARVVRELYLAETGLANPQVVSVPVLFAHNQAATIAGDLLVTGNTNRMELEMVDASGRITQIVRLRETPVEITQQHREAAEELLLARTTRDLILKAIRRALPNMPKRDYLPAFGRWAWEYAPKAQEPNYDVMMGDTEGNLWVISFGPPGALTPRPWMVIAPNGRWLGNVTLRPGFEPFDIGSDYILGWRKDENDLIRIEQYTLNKPAT